MARFFGKVGYGLQQETVAGVWMDQISERDYYGEILNTARYREDSDNVNDNVRMQQRISIVADPFAYENLFAIKYVLWAGSRWTVNSVEVSRPRLILTLGGVYDGPEPAAQIP